MGPLLRATAGVDDDPAARFAQLLPDVPAQLGHDLLIVPDTTADEELEVLAGETGLDGNRLDGLPRQPAEQPPDENTSVAALLLAIEERQVTLQEAHDVVAAAADVGRRN